ncbi:MAG: aminoglycoside phosphotransferase family protein [Oligoflexia bacterium]|nr:aminoglycoside phosphotransferase family protein [Oligoflexia bacterium]
MRASTALAAWGRKGDLEQLDNGLINRTWLVLGPTGRPNAVLQLVNPIFSPLVNDDIDAITGWLAAKGLLTPRLIPTTKGERLVPDVSGHWRLLSFIPGRTFDTVSSPALAHAAGALVGRFHAALADWPGTFVAPRRSIHDTTARMRDLRLALDAADAHPLSAPIRALGQQILDAWDQWQGTMDLPERPCHGDLKISNLRFDDAGRHALCMLDLDTLGPLPFSVELGDAWRSWCNPAGESDPDRVRFDLDIFTASLSGWLSTAPPLTAVERDSLVPGIERICLELAARFAADAVNNQYFLEDRLRWPQPGAHNLVRAHAQTCLAAHARAAAPACNNVLRTGSTPGP